MFNPDFEKELEEAIKRASNFANDNFVTVNGNVDKRLIEEAKKKRMPTKKQTATRKNTMVNN